jgi:L-arabinokinase
VTDAARPTPPDACPVLFYISGHGFGHASRSIELINALADRRPDLDLVIRSDVAPWLVRSTARPHVTLESAECDTGIVQIDSLRLDEAETVRRAAAFMATFPERVRDEAARLRARRVRLVVADIPALGIAAASEAGVPAVALGNFSWDWAYAAYPGGAAVAEAIAEAYRRADLALRLPLWGGFAAFRTIVDLPFIARRSHRDPDETRAALDLPSGEPLALVSFGGYGVAGVDLDALQAIDGFRILVSASTPFGGWGRTLADVGRRGRLIPVDEPALFARGFRYEDLVRAVDVVVTKPGYGIIAECAANDTAMLYTSRGRFVEYDVLVAGIGRYVRAAFISQDDLFAGRWGDHLTRLLAAPPPTERPRVDGAKVGAGLLMGMMGFA